MIMNVSANDLTMRIERTLDIDASPEAAFQSILDELGAIPGANGETMSLKFEPWPGGRWFRDTGNGTGHLWAHVQVIKPPRVLELSGPMMVSSATVNHIQYRVVPRAAGGCTLHFCHTGLGLFDAKLVAGMEQGWTRSNDAIKRCSEQAKRG